MLNEMYERARSKAAGSTNEVLLMQCQRDIALIDCLPTKLRTVCEMRVLHCMKWGKVADQLHYTDRWLFELVRRADKRLEEMNMKNEIKVFENQEFGAIRTVMMNDEPWFVAADVCGVFGVSNSRNVTARLDDDEKGVTIVDTPGGKQNVTVVNEAGLYHMLFSMEPNNARGVPAGDIAKRIEQLKSFKRWITHEVIPSIRKHGAYMTPQKLQEVLLNPDTLIQLANTLKEEQEKNRKLTEKVEQDKPKVLFAESVECSGNEILVGELAKILKQNGMDIGQNRLFERLRKDGYLIGRKGTDYNMPTQRSMDMGLMRIKETSISHSDGHVSVSKTPKITGKGQVYFVNKYIYAL